MAQLVRVPRHVETSSKSATTPTVEQLLRVGEAIKASPTSASSSSSLSSPLFDRMKHQDPEEDHSHPQKKSVLSKVKEKAKKLRHSLSKKKHEDGNVTPTWGVSLEDDEEEEDAEYLGAPMYESELAPEGYKENARQHPRATPVISKKHVLPTSPKTGVELDREKPRSLAEIKRTIQPATTNPSAPNKIMNGTVTEKLTPAYAKGSDEALSVSTKMQDLNVSKPAELRIPSTPPARKTNMAFAAPQTPPARLGSKNFSGSPKTPRFSSAPVTPQNSLSSRTGKNTNSNDLIWDKGVSVKEYFINKLEPGEDEKALSEVISEAMSPRRTPGDVGVIEKVREAVNSLLGNEEPSQYAFKTPTTRASSQNPVTNNAQEVDQEENHGRVLQTN